MRVLSLCDLTGNMVRPWAEAGYECVCVDLQHGDGFMRGGISFSGADVMDFTVDVEYDFVIAQPPCTHLAGSGARWWADKGMRPLIGALNLVQACRDIARCAESPWMIENPVGRLSTCWRKPNHTFDPWEYAGYDAPEDHYTKRTCIWAGGGFVMPEPKPLPRVDGWEPPDKTFIHHQSPGPDRANRRSAAPLGFARAVFQANAKVLK